MGHHVADDWPALAIVLAMRDTEADRGWVEVTTHGDTMSVTLNILWTPHCVEPEPEVVSYIKDNDGIWRECHYVRELDGPDSVVLGYPYMSTHYLCLALRASMKIDSDTAIVVKDGQVDLQDWQDHDIAASNLREAWLATNEHQYGDAYDLAYATLFPLHQLKQREKERKED